MRIYHLKKLKNNKNVLNFYNKGEQYLIKNKFYSTDSKLYYKNESCYYSKINDKIVGLIIYNINNKKDLIYITFIFVDKNFRNKGILKKILTKFPKYKTLIWGFHIKNELAKKCYKKLGCKIYFNSLYEKHYLEAKLDYKQRKCLN